MTQTLEAVGSIVIGRLERALRKYSRRTDVHFRDTFRYVVGIAGRQRRPWCRFFVDQAADQRGSLRKRSSQCLRPIVVDLNFP